jgi:hypothetical protein
MPASYFSKGGIQDLRSSQILLIKSGGKSLVANCPMRSLSTAAFRINPANAVVAVNASKLTNIPNSPLEAHPPSKNRSVRRVQVPALINHPRPICR